MGVKYHSGGKSDVCRRGWTVKKVKRAVGGGLYEGG